MTRLITRSNLKAPVVSASPASSTIINVAVTPNAGFPYDEVLVDISLFGTGSWAPLQSGTTSTSVSATGLNAQTTYSFRSRTRRGTQYSPYSSTVSTATLAAQSDPALTLSSPAAGTVTMSISANPAVGQSIIAYQARRSLDESSWTTVTLSETAAASEIPAFSYGTPNFVVAQDGSGTHTTFAAAHAAASNGQQIAIKPGTYVERMYITKSLTVRAWDINNKPVFDGEHVRGAWNNTLGSGSLLGVQGDNSVVDGIIFYRSAGVGAILGLCNSGYFVLDGDLATRYTNIRVYRCAFLRSLGAAIQPNQCDNYTIAGCDIRENYYSQWTGTPSGWPGICVLMGANAVFVENVVYQNIGEGIHIGHHIPWGVGSPTGTRHIQATNPTVRNNFIYDCYSAPIYITNVDGGVIERNVVFSSADTRFWHNRADYPQYGIKFASEGGRAGGAYGTNGFIGARNLVVRNNVVTGSLRLFQFANEPGQTYQNLEITNNTLFRTVGGTFPAGQSALLNEMDFGELSGITFQNNLVHDTSASNVCDQWNPMTGTNTIRTNLWSHTPPSEISGTGDIVNATTGLTTPTYEAEGTPWPGGYTFNTDSFKILSTSPAVNAGTVVSGMTDYFGRTRPTYSGKFDIGAHSLSKPKVTSYSEASVPAGTWKYQVRYTQSDTTVSPWSVTQTITV